MEQADPIYQSFLVRCWLIPPMTAGDPEVWRFELREVSAESPKQHFSDLEQLKAFLAAKLTAAAAGSKAAGDNEAGQRGGEL